MLVVGFNGVEDVEADEAGAGRGRNGVSGSLHE